MNILVFAAFYPPYRGGYAESLHELLKRLVAQGVKVDVLATNTEKVANNEVLEGIHVHRITCWNPAWLNRTFPIPRPSLQTRAIFRSLHAEQFDVIVTNTRFFPTTFLGWRFARRHHTPLIHIERGGQHTIGLPAVIAWVSWLVDHTIGSLIVRSAAVSVGVSNAACDFLRHLGARRVERIPNGIDIEYWQRLSPERCAEIRRELGLQENNIALTFVGRLIPAKGVENLLHAIAPLTKKRQKLQLLIVGDGTTSYKTKLRALAERLGLRDNVLWLGPCAKERVREILSITDVFVNPSHSEGLPRTVLEAAAIGLPIIATDVGGTKEIIDDRRTGILTNPNLIGTLTASIEYLIANPECRLTMEYGARMSTSDRFKWTAATDRYHQIFLLLKNELTNK